MKKEVSKKEPKYVAFSTQKGGAGKTTLTVLIASYLHYVKGYNVAIVDCDYPQHSIAEMRERDFKMVEQDEYYKGMAYEQFTRLEGKRAYPVIESSTEKALSDADALCEQGEYDFVFFDLPGTMNNRDLVLALASMDYIIAPIAADRVVMESTLNYMIVVRDNIVNTGKSNIKAMRLLWNLVDGREKSELYEVYEGVIKELGFIALNTFIPDSKRFRREQSVNHKALFRSTLFPADKSLVKGSNIDALTDELLELING
ncbi:cellulose biosynthesis protein BcsQ [Dysgonomonas sp. PFB1-18]|uniref:ParA family protein n=1 Tax=unclassified Dysgonomonas TaxID=2630389 RepID=UPI002476F8C4|nr:MULTISPECIES: AAA family ATPase [unclassified Dysgonomonas]MDH6310663.1 cellulose biosynthesis protein BcsQ [Dysgonomonas sp. PF1-14]MDH6340514.1 cellulose biosynthesis protein BcsQ [Dysgonomonas sp. PF1-16]MDH6382078.1 cellulose biosynthesis protein BcsQ [Dysgonomonas sp. PFB1-18]MDH6399422.1 cellulose biosynthesis protein BcsQ [Dysgonomonas sp. PF1-23]